MERGESYSSVSILLGRNRSYLQQFIKRGTPRRLNEGDRRILAAHFGIAEELLAGGAREAAGASGPAFRSVRCLMLGETKAAPRPGANLGAVNVDPAWLGQLGVTAENISFCRVEDDAMAPTLLSGDEIMIDHGDHDVTGRAGLFVLRLDQALLIRNVARDAGYRFSIQTGDANVNPFNEIDAKRVEIIGRVIWKARKLF